MKKEDLYQILNQEVNNQAFPGGNIVVVDTKEKIFATAGNKQLYDVNNQNELVSKPVVNNLDTMYDLASLSKVISTTTSILILIDKGLLRLATKVNTYLPNFKHDNVTIWHLLTHTSGLPEGVRGLMKMHNSEDVMNAIYQTELEFEPGTKIKYSDIGFILLGKIIEKITNLSLEDFATKEIFTPLQMFHTMYNPVNKSLCAPTEYRNDSLYQGMVQGIVHDETALLLGGVAGHAGLFSTVEDMSHFIEMILNNGVYNEKRILSNASIKLIFEPLVEDVNGVCKKGIIRSIGWLVGGLGGSNGDLTSEKTIHHTGFTGTNIWIDLEKKVGCCLLTNRVHPTRNSTLHIDARGRIANYIMANIEK